MRNILGILLLFYCVVVCASSLSSCSSEGKYERKFAEILDWDKNHGEFSDEVIDELFTYLKDNPETFAYNFENKNSNDNTEEYSDDEGPEVIDNVYEPATIALESLYIINSNDSLVRAYVTERCGFGGNPANGLDTRTLLQYSIVGEIYTFEMPRSGAIIEQISHLSDNKYVIVSFLGKIAQGAMNNNIAQVYEIDKKGAHLLKNVFEVDGELCDDIEVSWEEGFFSSDTNFKELDIFSTFENDIAANFGIVYNWMDENLYVADTDFTSDHHEELTGTFKRFCWDGKIFKDITFASPFEVYNGDYYIRIEQSHDGTCTYQSWNGGQKRANPI